MNAKKAWKKPKPKEEQEPVKPVFYGTFVFFKN
jgi:hypothetical protein